MNLDELKAVLTQARKDNCVRFKESKGYKGAGFSVIERVQEYVTSIGQTNPDGTPVVITKTALKLLLNSPQLEGFSRFDGSSETRAPRAKKASFDVLGFFGVEAPVVKKREPKAANSAPSATQPATTTANDNWDQTEAQAAPVAVEEDDIF